MSQTSKDVRNTIERLNVFAKELGIGLDYRLRGGLRIDDLDLDLGFNNKDCNGVCSNNCSGCSACSGCSGCSTTNTVKSFDPGAELINPDPVARFLIDLRNPAVKEFLARAGEKQ